MHQQPSHISKFGFRFADEADGRYQLRTTTAGVTPAEVQELWSLEIKDQTTLLVVGSDPKTRVPAPSRIIAPWAMERPSVVNSSPVMVMICSVMVVPPGDLFCSVLIIAGYQSHNPYFDGQAGADVLYL